MNKTILTTTLISMLLSACSSIPANNTVPVQGALKNTHEIGMSLPGNVVKPSVNFAVTGYTIIGVAYVAAAVSTMNSHSETIQTEYQKYLQAHPDAPTLKDAFNSELKKELENRGINPKLIQVTKAPNAEYVIDGQLKEQKVVVLDGLTSQYFAADSGSDYHPRSSVLVSVFESNDHYAKPVNQERIINLAVADAYPNFEALNANPEKSYIGLVSNVQRLADKVADTLYQ
jgi:uncharacterized protein YcfL